MSNHPSRLTLIGIVCLVLILAVLAVATLGGEATQDRVLTAASEDEREPEVYSWIPCAELKASGALETVTPCADLKITLPESYVLCFGEADPVCATFAEVRDALRAADK